MQNKHVFDATQYRLAGAMSLVGMFLVLLTRLVRPGLSAFPDWMVFVFGILPNFGAGLGLPFVLLVAAARVLQSESLRTKLSLYFFLALGLVFFGLTAWEAVLFFLWGYPMDPYDLLATGIGVLCAASVWSIYRFNPSKRDVHAA